MEERQEACGWRLAGRKRPISLLLFLGFPALPVAAGESAGSRVEEIYAGGEGITVIDRADRKRTGEVSLEEPVTSIAFTSDGSRAFAGTAGGKDGADGRGGIYVLETASYGVIAKVASEPVRELRLHPGGKELHALEAKASAAESTPHRKPVPEQFRLRTVDVSGSKVGPGTTVMVGVDIRDFAVSPDGKTVYFLLPSSQEVRVAGLPAADTVGTISLSREEDPDETRVEAAPARLVLEGTGAQAAVLLQGSAAWGVLLIDLDARRFRRVVVPGGASPRAARFLPGGKRLLALAPRKILALDIAEGRVAETQDLPETFTTLALPADGSEIYLGAPIPVRTKGARGRSLLEIRDAETFTLLADLPVSAPLRVLEVAPTRLRVREDER